MSWPYWRRAWITSAVVTLGVIAGSLALHCRWFQPQLGLHAISNCPVPRMVGRSTVLEFPGRIVVVRLGTAAGDVDAYRRLRSLRSGARDGSPVVSVDEAQDAFDILLMIRNDALAAVQTVEHIRSSGTAPSDLDWFVAAPEVVESWEAQTRILEALYRQVRLGPGRPDSHDARSDRNAGRSMLADIVAVARHYSMPVNLFELAGTVDTDYIDGTGHIRAARWRSEPSPKEVVIVRSNGRALTVPLDDPSWKLTEEAMQYAHALYMQDRSAGAPVAGLPQPPPTFNSETRPDVCVTYAGRILRDLLDHCGGDARCTAHAMAVDPADPNVRLDLGVRRVALYAARVMQHLGALTRLIAVE